VQPASADVTIDGQSWVSSDEGHFTVLVPAIPAGKHHIEVRKTGYRRSQQGPCVMDDPVHAVPSHTASAPPAATTIHTYLPATCRPDERLGRRSTRELLRRTPVGVIGRPVGSAVQVDSTTNEDAILSRDE
jgi:hypothetical protein